MSGFSETMRRIRFEKRMTQQEFADLLGTTKQNISRYEKGEVSPMVTTAIKIASTLGITLEELNGEEPHASEIDNHIEEQDLWELREAVRRNPQTKMLFSLTKGATAKDIEACIALLKVLKGGNDENGEGDTP